MGHENRKMAYTMEITKVQHKGSHLNTMDKFHVYNGKLKFITIFNENLFES
jgi:hypothetical protein